MRGMSDISECVTYYGRPTFQSNQIRFPIHAVVLECSPHQCSKLRVIFMIDEIFRKELWQFIESATPKLSGLDLKPLSRITPFPEENNSDFLICYMEPVRSFALTSEKAAEIFMQGVAAALGASSLQLRLVPPPIARRRDHAVPAMDWLGA